MGETQPPEREAGSGGGEADDGAGRAPWLRFALVFGALAIGSELAYYGIVLDSEPFEAYLRLLARISGSALNLVGQDVTVHGAQIAGGGFAVQVAHGCDAIQVCALLTAAVIAFPARLGSKLWGVVAGIALLQVLNFARIITLFLIGARFAQVFQTVHEVVWPTALIVATIAAWVLWVRRETRGVFEAA